MRVKRAFLHGIVTEKEQKSEKQGSRQTGRARGASCARGRFGVRGGDRKQRQRQRQFGNEGSRQK
eukprot:4127611-Pleurochrysis_carterae.AAC.1